MTLRIAPPVSLGRTDTVERRALAHPDHISVDRAVLCMLTSDFHRHVSSARRADNWHRRVVIPRPEVVSNHDVTHLADAKGEPSQ